MLINLPKRCKDKQGFTLVELLITVTIIAIITTISVAVFGNVQRGARNSRRIGDIDSLNKALELHYNASVNQFCAGAAGTYCAPAGTWFSPGSVPTDPQTGAAYTGLPANGAATYNICANLEPAGTYCRANQQ